jgi:hypothetical protein
MIDKNNTTIKISNNENNDVQLFMNKRWDPITSGYNHTNQSLNNTFSIPTASCCD